MSTILPGLCSVTFRQLGVDEVIEVASRAGLQTIEWGADVHLRPGDSAYAARVREQCADVGVACPSYGSYFFAGKSPTNELAPLFANAEWPRCQHRSRLGTRRLTAAVLARERTRRRGARGCM